MFQTVPKHRSKVELNLDRFDQPRDRGQVPQGRHGLQGVILGKHVFRTILFVDTGQEDIKIYKNVYKNVNCPI